MILDRAPNTADSLSCDTLDELLRRRAASRPGDFALCDPSDRPAFTDGAPRRLTWAALDAEADRVARGLRQLGLSLDAPVALQLPNTVEFAIAFFGVLRAGCVPVLLPLAWRRREIMQALSRVAAKAAITLSRSGPTQQSEIMCYAASEVFALRFLLAFGRRVPDGVIAVDEGFGSEGELEPLPERGPQVCDHVAAVTFGASADGFIPVARSHAQLTAAALAASAPAPLATRDVILTTLLGSSLAGLATGLVASLVSGAPLVLHQPFSSRGFAGAIVTEGATHAVLPGAAVEALSFAGRLPRSPLRSLAAVWQPTQDVVEFSGITQVVTDIHMFGEAGFAAQARRGSPAEKLMPGAIGPAEGPPLVSTRISAGNELDLRGAMVPRHAFPGRSDAPAFAVQRDGSVSTGIPVTHGGDGSFTTAGEAAGVLRVGGLVFAENAARTAVAEELTLAADQIGIGEHPLLGNTLVVPDHVPRPEGVELSLSPALLPQSGAEPDETELPHAQVA